MEHWLSHPATINCLDAFQQVNRPQKKFKIYRQKKMGTLFIISKFKYLIYSKNYLEDYKTTLR